MKRTDHIMGMPITVEIVGSEFPKKHIDSTFEYFKKVDDQFSTYKKNSEISRINHGLAEREWSEEMRGVLALCAETKRETDGYFDIRRPDGSLDPSGLVKGWAIQNAAFRLLDAGVNDFYIEAGGDIQTYGKNSNGENWTIGIRNPFEVKQIVKTVALSGGGVATSGTYIRGQHIYNPHATGAKIDEISSITVIGPNIYEADRFATAAFAMGKKGIHFIENLQGFDGYMIDSAKIAVMTSGFERYVA